MKNIDTPTQMKKVNHARATLCEAGIASFSCWNLNFNGRPIETYIVREQVFHSNYLQHESSMNFIHHKFYAE